MPPCDYNKMSGSLCGRVSKDGGRRCYRHRTGQSAVECQQCGARTRSKVSICPKCMPGQWNRLVKEKVSKLAEEGREQERLEQERLREAVAWFLEEFGL